MFMSAEEEERGIKKKKVIRMSNETWYKTIDKPRGVISKEKGKQKLQDFLQKLGVEGRDKKITGTRRHRSSNVCTRKLDWELQKQRYAVQI